MIQKVRIQNFRCLRDLTLELTPLTVLVGPNASGKSSILEALNMNRFLTADFPRTENTWKRENLPVTVTVTDSDLGTGHFGWEASGASPLVRESPIPRCKGLRLDLAALRRHNLLSHATALQPDGGNITNVFETLDRNQQIEVGQTLCALVPMFGDVQARPYPGLPAGSKILQFRDRWTDAWYRANEVSDGTMLLLAYLLLQYQEPPLDLITVEEPERGLHPYLLGKLVDFLRGLAEGRFGKNETAILLATHSPELLDFVQPEEVRFLSIGGEGETVVECPPTESPDWEAAFDEYRRSLRDAWLSGGLGGVPGVPA